MSTDVNVLFSGRSKDPETEVHSLGHLLGITFSRVQDDDLVRYEFRGPGFVLVAFGDHGFESEVDGHQLSSYDVVVDCVATEPELDQHAAEAIRTGIGQFVYRKLVARGDRAIVLRDLQSVIAASG